MHHIAAAGVTHPGPLFPEHRSELPTVPETLTSAPAPTPVVWLNVSTGISGPPPPPQDYRALLLSFIGSLTRCDDLGGDALDCIGVTLKRIGIRSHWLDETDLRRMLARMGVRGLDGLSLDDKLSH